MEKCMTLSSGFINDNKCYGSLSEKWLFVTRIRSSLPKERHSCTVNINSVADEFAREEVV